MCKIFISSSTFGYRNYGKTSAGRNSSRFDTCEIIDSAQEKYKAIPNEQYSPAIIRNIKEGMISIKCELIFPKAENAKEFAFGLSGMF